jgi:hypothetical protein
MIAITVVTTATPPRNRLSQTARASYMARATPLRSSRDAIRMNSGTAMITYSVASPYMRCMTRPSPGTPNLR